MPSFVKRGCPGAHTGAGDLTAAALRRRFQFLPIDGGRRIITSGRTKTVNTGMSDGMTAAARRKGSNALRAADKVKSPVASRHPLLTKEGAQLRRCGCGRDTKLKLTTLPLRGSRLRSRLRGSIRTASRGRGERGRAMLVPTAQPQNFCAEASQAYFNPFRRRRNTATLHYYLLSII